MRKIVSIEFENFRAFYGKYDSIKLPEGQNLLIYGENGSGKSSMFKALNNYLIRSRISSTPFVKNRYSQNLPGLISIEFAEFNGNPLVETSGSRVKYQFGSNITDNEIQFIQEADLTKGFLEYRNLLDIYLHKEINPNLFNLIVENLLGNYIPARTGGTYRLGTKWKQLQEDLTTNSYTRNDRLHQAAYNELPTFQAHLVAALNDIFADLNRMLTTYFAQLKISLSYQLQNLTFNYTHSKADWNTTADLRLSVNKDGIPIIGDYSDVLNEARLSAFSICLYLASLKRNPQIDLQILYLDDIFIGLDTGNRLPILKILHSEFSDRQIFISTYDRHWFELAQSFFSIKHPGRWLSMEFFVGSEKGASVSFDKPTVVVTTSNYDKAVRYLHHRSNPDYPAAANYFRKAVEKIIKDYVPPFELVDENYALLPEYGLSKLLDRTKDFLRKTANSYDSVDEILPLLHALLHPLSHSTTNLAIYKDELLILEKAILELKNYLISLDTKVNYRCLLGTKKLIKMTFTANQASNHHFYYELYLKSPLVLKNIVGGVPFLSETGCYVKRYYGVNGTAIIGGASVSKKSSMYHYQSLEAAYNSIFIYLNANQTPITFPTGGYISCCEWYNTNMWSPLQPLLTW